MPPALARDDQIKTAPRGKPILHRADALVSHQRLAERKELAYRTVAHWFCRLLKKASSGESVGDWYVSNSARTSAGARGEDNAG